MSFRIAFLPQKRGINAIRKEELRKKEEEENEDREKDQEACH